MAQCPMDIQADNDPPFIPFGSSLQQLLNSHEGPSQGRPIGPGTTPANTVCPYTSRGSFGMQGLGPCLLRGCFAGNALRDPGSDFLPHSCGHFCSRRIWLSVNIVKFHFPFWTLALQSSWTISLGVEREGIDCNYCGCPVH